MSDYAAFAALFRGTVVEMLFEAATHTPTRQALVCDGKVLSHAKYADAVLALARRLAVPGSRGVRIAVLLPSGIDACVAHFAVLASGAQLLPLNPAYTPRELKVQLDDAQCDALIADAALRPMLKEALLHDSTMRIVWSDGGFAATSAHDADAASRTLAPLEPGQLALLQYTGGTSGRPKGVELTHAALRANVEQREAMLPTRPDTERILCAMPLFHSYGMAMGLYLAARCRGALVILSAYRREDLLATVERERITVFPGSPAIFVGLMAHPRFAGTDWSSVKVCYSGASALPAAVLRQWEETVKVPIFEGYGQTEAGPVLSFNGPSAPVKTGSVGKPVPQTEIEIVDVETGRLPLGRNACGEIRARGPQLMQGYRNLPLETAQALRDGWLYTGDLGEFDDDGYLFIRGRKKDLIIVGGYNVYPREIEDVLLEHPAVLEAAVIGQADDYRGETLHAFIALREGMTASRAELDAHCARNLARYKLPAKISVVDRLPKTSVNKIDKKALQVAPINDATAETATGDSPC
ncbi:AMP-binding protein [Variovorax sp. PBL-E5]|uniref:AMP-binding protein n=1 Tax=Variovorax sp. PBL-E5 TaxID=434014 RepID=UPI0013197E14|nr:AMP-binding protein [Variovorax sp. PBL-E5]VTU20374.1 Long-chain-fatty-acid--CoA ligase [Variovorax sp. PBL-E5]